MKHTIKWGIIGLGNIAHEFAKSFNNLDNADLVAVASTSDEKLTKFKEKFNLDSKNIYNHYEDILDNENIDVIYIALPNSLHFKWSLNAIERNRNILIEKPAFIDLKQAENIFSHKNFKNIFFGEGYMYRYHPQIIETIKIIKSNQIGKILSIESNFGMNLVNKKNFFGFRKKIDFNKRIFNKNLGGGVIFDLGCYTTSMSILIASLNENIDINNFNLSNVKTEYINSNIDIESSAKINFDNKFESNVSVSFARDIGRKTIIFGETGKIILESSWNIENEKLKVIGKTNKELEFKDSNNIYSLEIKQVSKDISHNKTESSFPGINKKEILLNTKLINCWINGK